MAPRLRTTSNAAKPKSGPEHALYFYGVTQRATDKPLKAEGVDGVAAVDGIPCAGLTCWISRVSRLEYADRLSRNMEDLEWLAAASVRHQRVVSEIAAASTILPARFGTVFLSETSLAAHVSKHKRQLLSALKRIEGADEWGVKVFAVPPPSTAPITAVSGTEYLRRKAAAAAVHGSLDPEVRSFAEQLRRVAEDVAPTGKVSGGQHHLEWQASFLLRRSRQKQWRAILDRFAARWGTARRIECTGPWPPYSFVSADGK